MQFDESCGCKLNKELEEGKGGRVLVYIDCSVNVAEENLTLATDTDLV